MSASQNSTHFQQNLRRLLGQYPSIADGAATIGINRQQLNKYLNGTSFPSVQTLARIAEGLDVSPETLLRAPKAAASSDVLGSQSPIRKRTEAIVEALLGNSLKSEQGLKQICGDFLVYNIAAMHKDYISVSFARIEQTEGVTVQKMLTPLARKDLAIPFRSVIKSEALLLLEAEHVHFLRSTWGAHEGEIYTGLKIATLPRHLRERYIHGYVLAPGSAAPSQTLASPVIMKRLTQSSPVLRVVRECCGPFHKDDPRIDDVVRQAMVHFY